MGCPGSKERDALVAGRLDAEETRRLNEHLRQCARCRQEVAFATALRLTLGETPATPKETCLTDEVLCLLHDGALPEAQRSSALAHLQGCQHCLTAYTALDRALEEIEDEVIAPPADLVSRAVHLGAPGSKHQAAEASQSGWFERLFSLSAPWRLGLAGAAAGMVLLLTVLLAGPEPPVPGTSAPTPAITEPVPGPTAAPGDTKVAQPGPDQPAIQPDEPRAVPEAPTSPAPSRAAWLASLAAADRGSLAGQLQPAPAVPAVRIERALATSGSGLDAGYELGRLVAFLETFGAHLGDSTELRAMLIDSLRAVSPLLHSALPGDAEAERLSTFAGGLADKLDGGQVEAAAARRRLEVLTVALRELLSAKPGVGTGLELGLAVQQLRTNAVAVRLGGGETDANSALQRARRRLSGDDSLSQQARDSLLQDLLLLERTEEQPTSTSRAERILDDAERLERTVRAAR